CLVRNQGRMVTKDELLRQVWPDTFVEEINLAVNISTIRKVRGESPQECRLIATVPARRHRFIAEVRNLPNQNGNAKLDIAADSNPLGVSLVPAKQSALRIAIGGSRRRRHLVLEPLSPSRSGPSASQTLKPGSPSQAR